LGQDCARLADKLKKIAHIAHTGRDCVYIFVCHVLPEVNRQPWRKLLPDVFTFELTMLVDSEGTLGLVEQSALLPHEVFHTVYTKAKPVFDIIFSGGDENLEEWLPRETIHVWRCLTSESLAFPPTSECFPECTAKLFRLVCLGGALQLRLTTIGTGTIRLSPKLHRAVESH
jgi:hypothetical protein